MPDAHACWLSKQVACATHALFKPCTGERTQRRHSQYATEVLHVKGEVTPVVSIVLLLPNPVVNVAGLPVAVPDTCRAR